MTTHPGFGVMLNVLFGDSKKTAEAINQSIGKTISEVSLSGGESYRYLDALCLKFTDGSGIHIFDDGQSCCESRYMKTDDDLEYHVGATLLDVKIEDAPEEEDEDGTHEVQFLIIDTSKGRITCSNHNEHNGYYGGFAIVARTIGEEQ